MKTMYAITMQGTGSPDVLQLSEVPCPQAKSGEVLIEVHASGVNRPDLFQRQGVYPPPPDASPLLGLETAGVIVGGDVVGSDFKIGDEVFALTPGGAYAQYCVAPIGCCLPKPKRLTFTQAAGIAETAFTVWANVFQIGRLHKGETLLVHGGASGIGTMAIQIAVALGYKVFATAGSDERVQTIERLGGIGINYRTQDFVQVIKDSGTGVDVVLDMVAGEYIDRNIKCCNPDARIVNIAQLGGVQASINMARVMTKRIMITGSTLRPRSNDYKAFIAHELQQYVLPLIEDGTISPIIERVFPLSEAKQAHELLEQGNVTGKIILEVANQALTR